MTTFFERQLIASGLVLLLLLPLGLTGNLAPVFIWPVFLVHLVFLLRSNISVISELNCDSAPGGPFNKTAVIATIFFVLLVCILMSVVPVTARDALIHHLAIPKWWLEAGRIQTYPWYEISYYPMLIQLAFLPLLQFLPPQACAIYHLLYLIPLAGSAASIAQYLFPANPASSKFAFLIALTLPICLRLASEPLVDLPLAAFCGVATSLLFRQEIFGAVALGLALSTKYNALPFAVFLVLSAPLARIPVRFLARFTGLSFCIVAPWLVRNFLETGNPFFPLGTSAQGMGSIETRLLIYKESIGDLILTPISMLFFGLDEDPRRFDGVLSPILLCALFPLWGIITQRKNWQQNWQRPCVAILVLALAYFIFAQVSSGARVRYLMPIIPAIAAVAGLGISLVPRRVFWLLTVAHCGFVLFYLFGRASNLHVLTFLTSSQSSPEYLNKALPEYRFTQRLAGIIPQEDCVYMVLTGSRFFYLPFKAQSAGYRSGPELKSWLLESKLEQELKSRGCSFLLVNTRLLEKLSNQGPAQQSGLVQLLEGQMTRVEVGENNEAAVNGETENLALFQLHAS